ncbi:MAG: NAD(P)/FAD-dependent oxidoreductase [Sphingopyxis sp.]|uniref:flavin-containing monooxygenase n=1 Tax=Sphingopyxis sp. TaxID=1908224 RepID=UPI002AB80B55|nr:NAD(P)/FAD-dependent oxidoreductase [Sphingopyxis sp.]MDZ3832723.1 NAD(P)/FAD-dependent oxidoreductase [Sphingopyxis sp.]
MSDHDIMVIGAGQAGLAAAHMLHAADADFTIVDGADKAGGSWHRYYDSLTLFSPARYSELPGAPFPGNPDHYPTRDEVIAYLDTYAARFAHQIETGRQVGKVEVDGARYRISFHCGETRHARALVVATGSFGAPNLPSISGAAHFAGEILHSSDYREPSRFAGQSVIVVGGGNSAIQIAAELAEYSAVTLVSRDRLRFIPQRILRRDIHWWFDKLRLNGTGLFSDHGVPIIDDGRYRAAIRAHRPAVKPMFERFGQRDVQWADGSSINADAVIFATGYRPSLDFLSGTPAVDRHGHPVHRRGISKTLHRLGFVGLSGQNGFASATLRGVGRDAAYVIQRLLRR